MPFFRRHPHSSRQRSAQQAHPPTHPASRPDTPSDQPADTTVSTEPSSDTAQTPPEHAARTSQAITQPLHPLLSETNQQTPSPNDQPDGASEPEIEEDTIPVDEAMLEELEREEREEQAGRPRGTAILHPNDLAPPGSDILDDTQMLQANNAPSLATHRSNQTLSAAALRDVGRVRQSNQDSVLSLLTYLPREGTDTALGLFVVADGMGGHEGGEVASRLAIRTVLHQIFSQLVMPAMDDAMMEAIQPIMISALQEANRVIWDEAQIMGTDMGTTCTAALLLGQALYIAHVGDSRAYLREAGGLRPLTNDHSTVGRLIEMGQLDPSEAHEHPLRNQLYRTIGQQPQVQVDFIYQRIENSTHLLLCSDGLWGMVTEDHIEQALTRSPWPQDSCDELIALANLAGGEDNISAVVVTLPVTERRHA